MATSTQKVPAVIERTISINANIVKTLCAYVLLGLLVWGNVEFGIFMNQDVDLVNLVKTPILLQSSAIFGMFAFDFFLVFCLWSYFVDHDFVAFLSATIGVAFELGWIIFSIVSLSELKANVTLHAVLQSQVGLAWLIICIINCLPIGILAMYLVIKFLIPTIIDGCKYMVNNMIKIEDKIVETTPILGVDTVGHHTRTQWRFKLVK